MIKKLIPVIFLVLGLTAGVGAGVMLSPSGAPKDATADDKDQVESKDKASETKAAQPDGTDTPGEFEYLKLTKQFVVPVVDRDEIAALVTVSLSLEISPGKTEEFYAIEPKLRDAFLQVLFDHANTGGFDGIFTESDNLSALRKALLEVARKDLGQDVSRVLIMNVSRQDT